MRATQAKINLNYLKNNFLVLKSQIPKDVLFCAILKANAYGHDIKVVSTFLDQLGADRFGVACLEEAAIVRECGITKPIHLLSPCLPEEMTEAIELEVIPFISTIEEALLWQQTAKLCRQKIAVHIKIALSMARIGCDPEDFLALYHAIQSLDYLHLEGIATHFANGNDTTAPSLEDDLAQFKALISQVDTKNLIINCANSATLSRIPDSCFNMVRQGTTLYGYPPSDYVKGQNSKNELLKPVMTLTSRIMLIRKISKGQAVSYGSLYRAPTDTYLATIPCGYADGFANELSNQKAVILADNRLCDIAGFVCMDQFMIDLGIHHSAKIYDEVTLFGGDKPALTAAELCANTSFSMYTLLATISSRVPRVIIGASQSQN